MDKFDELLELCEKILPDVYSGIVWALAWNAVSKEELLDRMVRELAKAIV